MLATVPGLLARVEEVLRGIFATAVEIRRLPGRQFDLDGHARVRVTGYAITYGLDLNQGIASSF